MKSLREAAKKAFLDQGVISVREQAVKFQLAGRISLRWIIEELDPDKIRFETGHMEAGDVEGSARLELLSTGWWKFQGKLHDNGDLFGDNYAFVIAVNHKDQDGTFAVKSEGHIDAGEDDTTNKKSKHRNLWIVKNWEGIKAEGFKWHLHADPSIGSGEILPVVLKVLAIGGATGIVILWGGAELDANSQCHWEPADGGIDRVCSKEFE